jgi:two-component system cell cycle sensor histidine kinase/response regulator CckA
MNSGIPLLPPRILVADDTRDIHKDIRKILCPDAGPEELNAMESQLFGLTPKSPDKLNRTFQVDSAYQGKEALALLEIALGAGEPYAMAFVDMRMPPGWDGIETIRHLWAKQPDLQIVICTAYSDHSWQDIVQELGSSDNFVVLKKPFDNIELLQLAHALTMKWQLAKQARLRLHELDQLVAQQTAKLTATNEKLRAEIRRRERTELKLRGSEHRFQLAFKASAIPMAIMHAPSQTYLEVNEAFVTLLGHERADILGSSPLDLKMLVHPDDCDRAMEHVRRQGGIRDQQIRIVSKDGQHRDTLVSLEPVVLGEEPCLLVAMLDVSEQKKLEAQLRQSQKMDAIGQLAAGVAHDFNNLLTIIHGHASLQLARSNQDEQARNSLIQVKMAADRAASLTRQLLAFSRKQVMQFRPLCLNTAITQSEAMLQRLLGETIQLECEPMRGTAPVLADGNSIGQVLINLAVNARDAMAEGGQLQISTRRRCLDTHSKGPHPDSRPGEFVQMTVADTGCGMDTQILSRIFEPFFTTKPPGKGTGLGLSTVYGIIKQHGGWMEVESKPSVGTKVHVFLELTDREPENVDDHSPAHALTPPTPIQQATILVVEDEDVLREFVTSVLDDRGYKVLQAGDGIEAQRLAESYPANIDLLLTDMVMPNGVSGIDLAKALMSSRKNLRVLFTSGYSQELMDNADRLLSGKNFLPKPFDVNHLLGTVRNCLESPALQGSSECELADITR